MIVEQLELLRKEIILLAIAERCRRRDGIFKNFLKSEKVANCDAECNVQKLNVDGGFCVYGRHFIYKKTVYSYPEKRFSRYRYSSVHIQKTTIQYTQVFSIDIQLRAIERR